MCAKSVSIVGFNNLPEEYACLSLFCFGEKLLKTQTFLECIQVSEMTPLIISWHASDCVNMHIDLGVF